MRVSQYLFWLSLVVLQDDSNALPASISTQSDQKLQVAGAKFVDHQQETNAKIKHGRVFGRMPPKKGGSSVPQNPVVPVTQQGASGNTPAGGTTGGKGKEPAPPQTPDPQTSKGKKDKEYQLGKCGTQVEGVMIKNIDKSGKSPARTPKRVPNLMRTPKAQRTKKRPVTAPDDWVAPASGTKSMHVCADKVNMVFPKYPSSGDALEQATSRAVWEKKMVAYNAIDIDPCKNDYTFGKKPFPRSKIDGVWSYEKTKAAGSTQRPDTKDHWQTEHVMDAQIMKRFFQDMFEDVTITNRNMEAKEVTGTKRLAKIKRTEIPTGWISSIKGKADSQNQCDYLDQFWIKRWVSKDNAMAKLLSSYPSEKQHEVELLLLPGRLNNKKASVFSIDGDNVVSPEEFAKMTFHQKIDELREIVLLMGYLNTPDVAMYWKQLAVRIREGLQEIESDDSKAFIRQTDNFWFRQKNDKALEDELNKRYKSVKLATQWPTWINNFVKTRTKAMQDLLLDLFEELENDWEDAKTYAELQDGAGKASKAELEARIKKLKTHIKTTVKIQPFAIAMGTSSRPGTPDIEDPASDSETGGTSDSDTPIDTPSKPPTKPKPVQAPLPPMVIPIRPKPSPGPLGSS